MREILFRAKRTSNDEWVEGYIYKCNSERVRFWMINPDAIMGCEVTPETICQFTGLLDFNRKKIFENDIIKCTDGADEIDEYDHNTGIGEVVYAVDHGLVYVTQIDNGLGDLSNAGYCVTVIGNIFDNPELLEVNP